MKILLQPTPDSAEAHEALGSAYWSLDFEKALAEYEIALKYDPNYLDKRDIERLKGYIEQGQTAQDDRNVGRYLSADSFVKEVVKEVPVEDIEAHIMESFNKGLSIYEEGKYEESIEYFNESLELSHKLSREYTQIWYFKGHSLGRLGRKGEAIDCFEKALSLVKDPDEILDIHDNLGHLILFGTLGEPKYIPTKDDLSYDDLKKVEKHFKEAIEIFKELPLEKKQKFAESYEGLENKYELTSSLLIQKGDDSTSEDNEAKEMMEMPDKDNQSAWALSLSAQRLAEEGKIDLACNEYEEALSKTNDPVYLMNIHHNLGHFLLFRTTGVPKYHPTKDDLPYDDMKKAEKHLIEAIEIFKKLPLEKKQEFAELDEALEGKRKLAFSLCIQKGSEKRLQELQERQEQDLEEIKRKISEFESEIKHLDNERNKKFNDAGEIAYKEYLKNKPDQPPAVKAKWDEIQDIDSHISRNKQVLNDLKHREKKSGFLAKLGDSITSTAKSGKLKLDVHNLERKKGSVITEFGRLLYDSHKKGDNTLEGLSSIWQNIDDMELQISKNEGEIAKLRKYL